MSLVDTSLIYYFYMSFHQMRGKQTPSHCNFVWYFCANIDQIFLEYFVAGIERFWELDDRFSRLV